MQGAAFLETPPWAVKSAGVPRPTAGSPPAPAKKGPPGQAGRAQAMDRAAARPAAPRSPFHGRVRHGRLLGVHRSARCMAILATVVCAGPCGSTATCRCRLTTSWPRGRRHIAVGCSPSLSRDPERPCFSALCRHSLCLFFSPASGLWCSRSSIFSLLAIAIDRSTLSGSRAPGELWALGALALGLHPRRGAGGQGEPLGQVSWGQG